MKFKSESKKYVKEEKNLYTQHPNSAKIPHCEFRPTKVREEDTTKKQPILLRGTNVNSSPLSPKWQTHCPETLHGDKNRGLSPQTWKGLGRSNPYTGTLEAGLQSSNKEPQYGLLHPTPWKGSPGNLHPRYQHKGQL